MKFYYLQNSVNTEDTGPYFPQVQNLVPQFDYNSNKSIYRIYNQEFEFSAFEPIVDYAILVKGAKASDFLSSSMFVLNGFLITKRARILFEEMSLPKHKYYNIPVKADNNLLEYYWLHMLFYYKNRSFKEIQNENILFDKSTFVIEKDLKRISNIEIISSDQITETEKALKIGEYISASILVLKKQFINQVPDLFKLPVLNLTEWIINENTKNLIEENKLSGFVAKEINNIVIDD